MEKMKALVKTGKGKGLVEIREVPVPIAKENEVLIKIKAVGVCGTDIHVYRDEMVYNPPVILGHEFTGTIEAVEEKVKGWEKGERVIVEPHLGSCGICRFCRSGLIQLCPQKKGPGWIIDGAMAEYIAVPYHLLHRVPDDMSDEEAGLAEPAAIVANALLDRNPIQAEELVVVLGPGPIGLLAAQIARAYGARKVVLAGVDSDEALRLPLARKLGIDYVVNSQKEDLPALVADLSDGEGADLVIEASGAEQAINQAIDLVRINGRLSVIGIPTRERINVEWTKAVFKAINCDFSFSSSYQSWQRVVSMASRGLVDLKSLITHQAPLEEWESVFKDLQEGRGVKALLLP
ncbi:MAG: zinc-dependent alcohol dehydrogenase [Dethiobacteria bacterium]|jgi:L-iditol 2-dehydrogenase